MHHGGLAVIILILGVIKTMIVVVVIILTSLHIMFLKLSIFFCIDFMQSGVKAPPSMGGSSFSQGQPLVPSQAPLQSPYQVLCHSPFLILDLSNGIMLSSYRNLIGWLT